MAPLVRDAWPRSSRIRSANERETSRNDGNGWSIESADQEPGIAAGSEIGLENTLKVETRVQIPLGLPGETHRQSSRLHPGQGADTGFQATPKCRSSTLRQAGPPASRPAFVPQTTSPRHGAGRGWSALQRQGRLGHPRISGRTTCRNRHPSPKEPPVSHTPEHAIHEWLARPGLNGPEGRPVPFRVLANTIRLVKKRGPHHRQLWYVTYNADGGSRGTQHWQWTVLVSYEDPDQWSAYGVAGMAASGTFRRGVPRGRISEGVGDVTASGPAAPSRTPAWRSRACVLRTPKGERSKILSTTELFSSSPTSLWRCRCA
jgi:hypothetical protein